MEFDFKKGYGGWVMELGDTEGRDEYVWGIVIKKVSRYKPLFLCFERDLLVTI